MCGAPSSQSKRTTTLNNNFRMFESLPYTPMPLSRHGVFTRHDDREDNRTFITFEPHLDEEDDEKPGALFLFHDRDETCLENDFIDDEGTILSAAKEMNMILVFVQSQMWLEGSELKSQWYEGFADSLYVEFLISKIEGIYELDPKKYFAMGCGNGGSFLNFICHDLEGTFHGICDINGGVSVDTMNSWKLDKRKIDKKIRKLQRQRQKRQKNVPTERRKALVNKTQKNHWKTGILTITTCQDEKRNDCYRSHLGLAALGFKVTLLEYEDTQNDISFSDWVGLIMNFFLECNDLDENADEPSVAFSIPSSPSGWSLASRASSSWLMETSDTYQGTERERKESRRKSLQALKNRRSLRKSLTSESALLEVIDADVKEYLSPEVCISKRLSSSKESKRESIVSLIEPDSSHRYSMSAGDTSEEAFPDTSYDADSARSSIRRSVTQNMIEVKVIPEIADPLWGLGETSPKLIPFDEASDKRRPESSSPDPDSPKPSFILTAPKRIPDSPENSQGDEKVEVYRRKHGSILV